MKISLSKILILGNVLALLLVLITYLFPSQGLRIILGVPYLLFFPGLALITAIAPKREGPDTTARLVLSFALSIAIVPLIGFVLNYTPFGIQISSVLGSVSLFVFVTSVVAWLRLRAAGEDRATLEFYFEMPERAGGMWDNVLAIVMVLVIIGTLATATYYFIAPRKTEAFTQFYFLEQSGGYFPDELTLGEKGTVRLGITNHEGDRVSYRVQVFLNGKKKAEIGPVALSDRQKWQGETVIVPEAAGKDQKIEFLLFKGDQPEPYLKRLYLWVDVLDKQTGAGSK